ncbi:hypothetical protein [Cohnella luojiensis]|nr:hypothetical protein [Cohnella luojiensis]
MTRDDNASLAVNQSDAKASDFLRIFSGSYSKRNHFGFCFVLEK